MGLHFHFKLHSYSRNIFFLKMFSAENSCRRGNPITAINKLYPFIQKLRVLKRKAKWRDMVLFITTISCFFTSISSFTSRMKHICLPFSCKLFTKYNHECLTANNNNNNNKQFVFRECKSEYCTAVASGNRPLIFQPLMWHIGLYLE